MLALLDNIWLKSIYKNKISLNDDGLTQNALMKRLLALW